MTEVKGYGTFIKMSRIASGFKTLAQLAEKSGISAATLSRIEKEIQRPHMDTLKVLARFLTEVSLEDLMKVTGYIDADQYDLEFVLESMGPYQIESPSKVPVNNQINVNDFDPTKIIEAFDKKAARHFTAEEKAKIRTLILDTLWEIKEENDKK